MKRHALTDEQWALVEPHLPRSTARTGRPASDRRTQLNGILWIYEVSLRWVMRNQFTMALVTMATVALTFYLYAIVPKGFFPQQDTGRLQGQIVAVGRPLRDL